MDASLVSRREDRSLRVVEWDVSMARKREVASLTAAVIAVVWATEVASMVGRLDTGCDPIS